jgi:hypothetical protein
VTCVNTIRGYPLRRRCPPYVRTPGHPRRRSRVQLRTGPYSPPKPQAEAPPATGYPAGGTTREHHRTGLPRIPGMLRPQPPQQTRAPAIYPRCTLHLLPADPRRWQRRNHPRPAPPDATHPIGPGQHENDTRRKSRSPSLRAPSPGSADVSALSRCIFMHKLEYSLPIF